MNQCFNHLDIILGSQSPRRNQLLKEIGLNFRLQIIAVDEVFPENLSAIETAIYLSELKARAFPENDLKENSIFITADTVVSLNNQLLGKPTNKNEAIEMLNLLSGKSHDVISAFTLRSRRNFKSFYDITEVTFKKLNKSEIDYYIEHFQPFDKAGAYGIQEWIGKIGIEKIQGSYFNVMGLPVHKVYAELCTFELLK